MLTDLISNLYIIGKKKYNNGNGTCYVVYILISHPSSEITVFDIIPYLIGFVSPLARTLFLGF